MKVDELIRLSGNGRKEYDFSQRIVRKYMPYGEKCALVKSIVDCTSYEDIVGKKVYKRNTKSMLFVFMMKVISSYTDLEFEQENAVIVYDALMETGIMDNLLKCIPESELHILHDMLDMQRSDVEFNTRSLVAYLETKDQSDQLVLDRFEKAIQTVEQKQNEKSK